MKDLVADYGDVAHAIVGRRTRNLEITERQVRIERLPVLTPVLCTGLQIGHFPARLADLGKGGSASVSANSWRTKRCCASVSQYTSKEKLHQVAKAFLALA